VGGHVVCMGEIRNAYKILIKPECKRSLGINRHILEDNIKMDLEEMLSENADWIHLDQLGDQ